MKNRSMVRSGLFMTIVAAALAGCGGGGGGTTGGTGGGNSSVISGVVAAGAPLAGIVVARGANGATASTTVTSDGSYSLNLSGLTSPFLLYAQGIAGGRAYTIASAATTEDLGGTVNVTPLTDLVVANVAQTSTETFLASPDFTKLTRSALNARTAELRARIADILIAAGVPQPGTIDLIRTPFQANHAGLDAVLDSIDVSVSGTNATITNRHDLNQTITDDLSVTTDSSLLMAGTANIATASATLVAIRDRVRALAQLVAGGANAGAIAPFIDPAFSFGGIVQSDMVGFLTDPTLRADAGEFLASLQKISLLSFSSTAAAVSWNDEMTVRTIHFTKDSGGNWMLSGDQTPFFLSVHVEVHKNQGGGANPFSQIGANIDGDLSAIGANDYFLLSGPGLPSGFTMIQREFNQVNGAVTPSTFFAFRNFSNSEIDAMSDGGTYTFTHIRDTNADTTFVNPTSGTASVDANAVDDQILQSYTVKLVKKPVKTTETATPFPVITSPSSTGLKAFSSGTLPVTWTIPLGFNVTSVTFDRSVNGIQTRAFEFEATTGLETTTNLIVPAAGAGTLNTQSVIVFGKDVFERTVATQLNVSYP